MKIAYIGIDLLYPALPALYSKGCSILKIFSCKTDNITEFNVKVIEFAHKYRIPVTLNRITSEDISELKKQGCELIISAGYYYRIPVDTDIPMINIHPTLLPVGRGVWPMPEIIMRGYDTSGVTFHKITNEFDEGDIVLQCSFSLDKRENHMTYMEKVCDLLPEMVDILISDFSRLYEAARAQGEGLYFENFNEDRYTLTSQMTIEEADLILRAFYGYECIFNTGNKLYEIIGANVTDTIHEGYIGFPLKDGYVETKIAREL